MKDTQPKQGSISPKRQRQSNKSITLASFAPTWLSGVENLCYPRRALDVTYILRYLGQCEVQTLTPQLVRNFYAALAAETTLAFTTREGVHITLSAICNSAIAAGHLKYNPCFHSFSYAAQPESNPILTTHQVKQFLACLASEHPKHRLYYTLLIATGLRRSECLALQWQDINWQTKSLTVAHRVAAVRGEAARLLPVKPVSATLSAPLAQALKAYQIAQNKEDGFIFAQPNGAPMMPSSFIVVTSENKIVISSKNSCYRGRGVLHTCCMESDDNKDSEDFCRKRGFSFGCNRDMYRLRLIRQKHGVDHITTDSLYRYHHAMRRQISLAKLQKKLGV